MSSEELLDRFRACLLGFAVGDALGFPLRGVPPSSLKRLPELADDFAPRPRGRFAKGQFSDDTQLMLATAESVALERRVDGRSVAAHYAWLWQEGVVLQPPAHVSESAERLLRGAPWMTAGAPCGVRDPSVLSRGVVAGMWNAGRPERIPHDASVLAVITHKDPLAHAACAALAKAVSLELSGEGLSPVDFCEEVAVAASAHDAGLADEVRHLPRVLSWEVDRALELIRRVGVPASELIDEPGLPPHVTPVLLCALYVALKVPHDFREALARVLCCGGEADVAAGACGAILGARLGTEGIPARLRRNVLYADHLADVANRLLAARAVKSAVPAPAYAWASRR